ncbi:MAG: hypothetical protein ACO3GY_03585, partial [Flavobacteriaceae bacterium]
LAQLHGPCGYIGTLGMGTPGQLRESGMTTPDALHLQAEIARMRDAGMRTVAIEALHPYKLVKDVRSNFENTDVESVMNGHLNPFLKAYLMTMGQKTK